MKPLAFKWSHSPEWAQPLDEDAPAYVQWVGGSLIADDGERRDLLLTPSAYAWQAPSPPPFVGPLRPLAAPKPEPATPVPLAVSTAWAMHRAIVETFRNWSEPHD